MGGRVRDGERDRDRETKKWKETGEIHRDEEIR